MISKSPEDLQKKILDKLTFLPHSNENNIIYKNIEKPELGYLIKYSRPRYYDFIIGNYTIPSNFSFSFHHSQEIIRFGTMYVGNTSFEIENNPTSSSTPSSFFVIEKDIKGKQYWKKGQNYQGAEIIISKCYFDEVIKPSFQNILDFDSFIENYTYHYLPIEIIAIIQKLKNMAETHTLTPIYLESKILESIALLYNEISSSKQNAFTTQINYGQIKIGKDRQITLSFSDAQALQKANDILTENILNPPTIKSLSKMVFLNEQKLKAGFKKRYNMTINEYTSYLRMAMAENLLSTTEYSIDEIAKMVGYNHSSNFIKMFKKAHGKTPLAFRKSKT